MVLHINLCIFMRALKSNNNSRLSALNTRSCNGKLFDFHLKPKWFNFLKYLINIGKALLMHYFLWKQSSLCKYFTKFIKGKFLFCWNRKQRQWQLLKLYIWLWVCQPAGLGLQHICCLIVYFRKIKLLGFSKKYLLRKH